MSFKAVAWTVLLVMAVAGVLLLNYWAAYQPLSTLVYLGIVLALCGLANLIIPFRFLGVRKRFVGAIVMAGGAGLALVALLWPAPIFHVTQHKTVMDDAFPEYQFFERHSTRVHARPEQVLQAVREIRFGDMRSLSTLLKIRDVASRVHNDNSSMLNTRVLDGFAESGYLAGGSDHEILMAGGANTRTGQPLRLQTLQEFTNYREPGGVKCTLTTETRVLAVDESTRSAMGRYWRLIVPGSGLLRLQWLEAIKRRAESMPAQA